jgi:galactose mutarotase-like enzyme
LLTLAFQYIYPMTIIENHLFKVAIRNQGGELTSFFNKTTGVEHLWQGDVAIWPWHAPNLFPIVGQLIDNELLVDGKTYECRDMVLHVRLNYY